MKAGDGAPTYGSMSIGLHWLMLALLVAVYACINLRELYPKGSDPREALKMWHFMLGISVLLLVVVRIAARLMTSGAQTTPQLPRWQRNSSGLMHAALYIFMFAMPILGWLMLSAGGKPVPVFGLHLPALIGVDETLAASLKQVHETIGTVGYYLIGLHAAAALFHHYIKRDNTLLRMLPRRLAALRPER